MLKALWLASWYPNIADPTNGDFVQRHAIAASRYCKTDVIHVWEDEKHNIPSKHESYIQVNEYLFEHSIVFPTVQIFPFLNKLINQFRYFALYRKAIQQYILKNGKPDIVHVHIPMKAGLLALWLKRKYTIPFVVTEHWAIYNSYAPDNFQKRTQWFKYYTKKILLEAACFLPVSKELGNAVQQTVAVTPFNVIPNVADINHFNFQQPLPHTNFRFVHVSTMIYQKNPESILRVFQQLVEVYPAAELVMVGPCPSSVKAIAQKLPCFPEKITFTGSLNYAEVATELKAADALILFSHYENLPCVIIEALCCGVPVISSDVGGISEIIDSANGILVPPSNEEELFKAMITMMQNQDHFDRKQISQSAINKFSYEVVGKQIANIYEGVIVANSSNRS